MPLYLRSLLSRVFYAAISLVSISGLDGMRACRSIVLISVLLVAAGCSKTASFQQDPSNCDLEDFDERLADICRQGLNSGVVPDGPAIVMGGFAKGEEWHVVVQDVKLVSEASGPSVLYSETRGYVAAVALNPGAEFRFQLQLETGGTRTCQRDFTTGWSCD